MKVSQNRSSYTVARGDCLWNIARRNGVSLKSLIAANPQIRNPDLIHPGEKLNMPGAGGAKAGSGAPPKRTGLAGLWDRTKDVFQGAADTVKGVTGQLKNRLGNMLNIARAQVGTLESGNNAGAITKYTGGKTGWPWCAKFVSWAYRQAGMPLPGGDQWGVAGIKSIIKRLDQWKTPSNLQPGMAVTFKQFSHVEIIAKPVEKNGRLIGYMTIGGNTYLPNSSRQGVAYKFRALSDLEGGGYPVKA